MKKFQLSVFLSSWLLTCAMVTGTILCPMTAFQIPYDLTALVLFTAAASLVFSLLFTIPKGWIGVLVLLPLLGYALLRHWEPVTQALALAANQIAPSFLKAFHVEKEYIIFPGIDQAQQATALNLALTCLLSLLLAWITARRPHPLLALVPILPFVILCLIILETEPAPLAVLLVFGPVILLILSHLLAEHNSKSAAKLRLLLTLPLALLLTLVLAIFPPEDYQRAEWPDKLRYEISDQAQRLVFLRQNAQTGQLEFVSPFAPNPLGIFAWNTSVEQVDLEQVGPMTKSRDTALWVRAQGGGTMYLRGSSMGDYGNNRWSALPKEQYKDLDFADCYLSNPQYTPQRTVDVTTNLRSGIAYVPYYATDLYKDIHLYGDAYVRNAMLQTEYSFSISPADAAIQGYGDEAEYAAFVREHYLQLPDGIRAALDDYMANTLVAGIPENAAHVQMTWQTLLSRINRDAFQAEDYRTLADSLILTIQEGKTYDLKTPQAPEGTDFALWFLNDSDTGYCVHFATAATLLLRYCGIPARYVTGYMVNAMDGMWTTVTEGDAHAWVEIYLEGFGWQLLEATPAADDGGELVFSGESNEELREDAPKETDESKENKPDIPESQQEIQRPQQKPGVQGPGGAREGERKPLSKVWITLIVVVGVAALWLGYRFLMLYTRDKRFTTGSTNRRAVMLYRHYRWLCKLRKENPSEDLLTQAERAKFSQHTMTEEEVQVFRDHCSKVTSNLLHTNNIFKLFVYRMILVID